MKHKATGEEILESIKIFSPTARYQVGVRKATTTGKITFDKDFLNFIYSGDHFIDNKCPDSLAYFKLNPDNLDPANVWTIAKLSDDGNTLIYMDSATPQPMKDNSKTLKGIGEDAPKMVGSDLELYKQQKELYEQRKFELEITALKEKSATIIEQKDITIADLRKQIEDIRTAGTAENIRLFKTLEDRDITINDLMKTLDETRASYSQKLEESYKLANEHKLEANKAIQDLTNYKELTQKEQEALKLHQERLAEIEKAQVEAEEAGLSGLTEIGLGALGEFAKSPLIQGALANLMNGFAKKMGVDTQSVLPPAMPPMAQPYMPYTIPNPNAYPQAGEPDEERQG